MLSDVFACNKIYKKSFFKQALHEFPVGVRYEDQLPSLKAYVKAEKFDIIPDVVYDWSIRTDGSSISQQKARLDDISDRLKVIEECKDFASRYAPAAVYERLLEKVLGLDLRPYFDQMARQKAKYWAAGQQPVARLLVDVDENIILKLHPVDRAYLWAIRSCAKDDLATIATNVSAYGRDYCIVPHDGVLKAELEFSATLQHPIEDRWLRITEADAARCIQSKIYDISISERTVTVIGSVYVRNMRLSDIYYQVTMKSDTSACPIERLRFEESVDISKYERINHMHMDYDSAGFIAVFLISRAAEDDERYVFEVTVGSSYWRQDHKRLIADCHESGPVSYGGCVDSANGSTYYLKLMESSGGDAAMVLARASTGYSVRPQRMRNSRQYLAVSEAEVTGDQIHCKGTYRIPNGATGLKIAFFSSNGAAPLFPEHQLLTFGEFLCVFRLTCNGRPLGTNRAVLRLVFTNRNGVERTVWSCVSYSLNRTLPTARNSNGYLLRLSRTPNAGALHIDISPPWISAERGKYRQKQLQQQYQAWVSKDSIAKDSFMFESFGGTKCDDSPLALSIWVRANRPGATIYWSVTDHSVPIPEGAIPLIRYSRDWYEALASVKYLVNNNNFPYSFRKAKSQIYIQTWHVTPLKRIGNDVPAEHLSLAYRDLMTREVKAWDYLLAQNKYSRECLPRAFGYQGRVLLSGYPRNDKIASASGSSGRLRIRQELGISDDSFVLLYAPTWRDAAKLRTGGYSLELFLDIEKILSAMPDVTILVRGHPNTAKSGHVQYETRCLDVRNYPRLTSLFVASDCLITDYSSIMFDYANTGKPIVHMVPDLSQYGSNVRGFYVPLESIAPGPLCFDTDEVLQWIDKPSALAHDFRDRYKRFVDQFVPLDDGQAAERVWNAVLQEQADEYTAYELAR
jgi:CDP-glycerol glycerophosphotransferase (TagB/SpsB family)